MKKKKRASSIKVPVGISLLLFNARQSFKPPTEHNGAINRTINPIIKIEENVSEKELERQRKDKRREKEKD